MRVTLCGRSEVQGVCFDKTTNITDHLHKCIDKNQAKAKVNEHAMVAELLGKMKAK